MPIPPNIQAIVNRLYQELNETEQEATQGLNLIRDVIAQFPENAILIQYFAYFNAILLFIVTSRRQVQAAVENISSSDASELIQESDEDLGTILGQVLEAKMRVRQTLRFLEDLP